MWYSLSEHQKLPAKRHSVASKNTGIFSVTTVRIKPLVFYSYIHYLVCLMMLFIAKFNTELECGKI